MSYPQEEKVPLIVVFDLDGTLVGRVHLFAAYWYSMKAMGLPVPPGFKTVVVSALRSGLVRPHIKEFMERIVTEYGVVEFFVYTASRKGLSEFLVSCIETVASVRFNRPVFSHEEHTFRGYKSIDKIVPDIQTRLLHKYGHVPDTTIKKNAIVFDDRPHVYDHDHARDEILTETTTATATTIIKCPKYEYFVFFDLLASLPQDALTANHERVAKIIGHVLGIKIRREFIASRKNVEMAWALLSQTLKSLWHEGEDRHRASTDFWMTFDTASLRRLLPPMS